MDDAGTCVVAPCGEAVNVLVSGDKSDVAVVECRGRGYSVALCVEVGGTLSFVRLASFSWTCSDQLLWEWGEDMLCCASV